MAAVSSPDPPKTRDTGPSDARLYLAVVAISVAALAPLAYVLLLRGGSTSSKDLAFMPGVNASLNGVAAACQVAGYFAIKKKRRELHTRLMIGALTSSALFFVGYLVYHYVHGDTRYPGTGALRGVYLSILASHVVLSIVLVPLLLVTVFRAYKGTFDRHKALARWTLPIWLYVSVTGVVVFWMLKSAGA